MFSQLGQRTNGGSSTTTINRQNGTPSNKVMVKTSSGAKFVNRNSSNGQRYIANRVNKPLTTVNKVVNSILLKNMTKNYLQSCYLNTYTTLAYLVGQTNISDAVLARYIISLETLLSKMNGKLSGDRERMFENLWNKTRNYENKNNFSSPTNIEQTLKYYKNIMANGFKYQSNSRIAALSRNLK